MRALLLALVLTVPSIALAQDPPVAGPEIHVYGHAPTPITSFVPRAHVRFDRVDGTHHALDRIVESVTHAPF